MIKPNESDYLLTLPEAASKLGVKTCTLRRWRLLRKHLTFVTAGRAVRVSACSLDRFIANNSMPPREAR